MTLTNRIDSCIDYCIQNEVKHNSKIYDYSPKLIEVSNDFKDEVIEWNYTYINVPMTINEYFEKDSVLVTFKDNSIK
jgi:hypothetical protein